MPRIQLGAVGLEAQTLPVRYAAPSIIFLFSFDLNKASKFENKIFIINNCGFELFIGCIIVFKCSIKSFPPMQKN